MRGGQDEVRAPVLQFTNCRILRGRALLREDLWVREGRIVDPEKLFFEERRVADEQRDCGGCILAPGFIDVQINGGFGVDFSQATEDVGSGVALVARRILSHGVTSFCPTLVTSPPEVYHKVLAGPMWGRCCSSVTCRLWSPYFSSHQAWPRPAARRLCAGRVPHVRLPASAQRRSSASPDGSALLPSCASHEVSAASESLYAVWGGGALQAGVFVQQLSPWTLLSCGAPRPLPSPRSFLREVWAGTPACLSASEVLPQIPVKSGGPHGAGVLGVHLEGPFISREKRGAHPEAHLRSFEANAFHDVLATYGPLDNVRIVTLAPELGRSREVIRALAARGICVSLGHSVADLQAAEEAVQCGATFITHLFNAMLPFHHRDPGIVGLLTSDRLPPGRHIFYGMIADGTHTNPAALRIAHRAHPHGLVLVTDAVPALGLGNGRHTLGQQEVEVDGLTAYVAGTKTLSGSIAPMDVCVRHFLQATGCSVELALEAASLHPAQLLGLEKRKGTLDFGADAGLL
uniref:N-acetylglucosamine-6-phosphate deacetylase isoform X2 n=1 Tax=Halichoerus grypus TaxID=9711 RepID=UPI001659DC1B|nr:N-acetylglucosamine-6-phosphate deacetylase isoform X2 [Halichoerus grypus]